MLHTTRLCIELTFHRILLLIRISNIILHFCKNNRLKILFFMHFHCASLGFLPFLTNLAMAS